MIELPLINKHDQATTEPKIFTEPEPGIFGCRTQLNDNPIKFHGAE